MDVRDNEVNDISCLQAIWVIIASQALMASDTAQLAALREIFTYMKLYFTAFKSYKSTTYKIRCMDSRISDRFASIQYGQSFSSVDGICPRIKGAFCILD